MAVSDATWLDQAGHVRLVGQLDGDFGGLPTGWEQDAADPANVQTHGGQLAFGDTGNETEVTADGRGFYSAPASPNPCYTAANDQGATVALDCGALPIVGLPTSDPHIAGALYNLAGVPTISTG